MATTSGLIVSFGEPGLDRPLLAWTGEGQIHRLKLVKRQGYGRAGFALLRQRVLQAV
jgi:hypothetical protein